MGFVTKPLARSLVAVLCQFSYPSPATASFSPPPKFPSRAIVRMSDASAGEAATLGRSGVCGRWSPVTDLLDADPRVLSAPPTTPLSVRLAKDVDFASSVQEAWRAEIDARESAEAAGAVGAPIRYKSEEDGTILHGYAVRPSGSAGTSELVPGIILFHTGAGPQDIFLRWKGESLVTDADLGGCVVLIADIISDGEGWAWDADRTKYNAAREEVLRPNSDGSGERELLQRRIRAAVDALKSLDNVDAERLGAFGFCMGGHPVLEIARMKAGCRGIKAVATFHGVFDGTEPPQGANEALSRGPKPHALICHGSNDPFVRPEELKACEKVFRQNGWEWELLEFDGVRHGFTNPAQNFNPSDAFAFDDRAASASWEAARALVKRLLADR